MQCDVIIKATKVDGVYDADPNKNEQARRFKELSYMEAIQRSLKIMDMTAFSLCMENEIPIIVFDIFESGNLQSLLKGVQMGTLISSKSSLVYG